MSEITELGLHEDGSFRFHIPVSLTKSREDGKIWIEGVASVETPDLVGETVILKGMDLNYFLRRGFFNDNHDRTTGGKIGIPVEAKAARNGLYVKGYLLDTPRAQKIVELADALEKAGGERRLGFSIEGKVKERDGKLVKKSWLKDIAITAEPVHPDTYLNIVKSLSAKIESDGYIDEEGGLVKIKNGEEVAFWTRLGDVVTKSVADQLLDLKKTLPVQITEKSLDAGHQNPPQNGGSALRTEDLESGLHSQDIASDTTEEDKKKKKKLLSKAQVVEVILSRGYTPCVSERMADLLLNPQMREFLTNCRQ